MAGTTVLHPCLARVVCRLLHIWALRLSCRLRTATGTSTNAVDALLASLLDFLAVWR